LGEPRKYPEFRRKLTLGWWLSNRRYTAYMLRELTSFFVMVFSLLYIYQLSVLASRNTAAYNSYLGLLRNPVMVVFSAITLAFCIYHSVTWFYLIGKVQPIKVGKRTTTPVMSLAVNTVLMAAVSYGVVRLFLLGGL